MTSVSPTNISVEIRRFAKHPIFWIFFLVAVVTTILGFTPLSENRQWLSGFGVLAFWIAAFGIALTLVQLSRSQRAVQAATEATNVAVQNQSRYTVTIDTLVISESVNQIRRFQQFGEWIRAHERYPAIRRGLSGIAEQPDPITDNDRKWFRQAIQKLVLVEEKIGDALGADQVPSLTKMESELLMDIELRTQELSSKLSAVGGITHA